MADISKADLKKEIAEILEGADLTTTTAKKVRQQVEEKLKVNLASRKKEIDEIVMQCLEDKQSEKKSKGKKNGKAAADDDDEEDDDAGSDAEEDEEEDEESEEEKPKKRAAAPKKPAPKKRKADSDDDDDDASDDEDEKDDDYSPAKKKKGAPKKKSKGAAGKKGRKKKGSDSDSDEDWGKAKKKPAAAGGAKKKTGYGKDCNLSPELASIVGSDVMPRHEVVKRIWAYIKEKNLYDPTNKQFCVCDADLQKVMGVKKFRTFGMMKHLKTHFLS